MTERSRTTSRTHRFNDPLYQLLKDAATGRGITATDALHEAIVLWIRQQPSPR